MLTSQPRWSNWVMAPTNSSSPFFRLKAVLNHFIKERLPLPLSPGCLKETKSGITYWNNGFLSVLFHVCHFIPLQYKHLAMPAISDHIWKVCSANPGEAGCLFLLGDSSCFSEPLSTDLSDSKGLEAAVLSAAGAFLWRNS